VLLAVLTSPAYALEKSIILVSDNPADLAIAQSLGERLGIEIVVTPWGTLSDEAVAEIEASGATQVYVIGGEVAVPDVEVRIKVNVNRLGGKDRYETAARVAREWSAADEVVIVDGYDEEGIREALAKARVKGVPVLFVKPDEVPEEVGKAIEALGCRAAVMVPAPNMAREKVKEKIRGHGVEEVNETAVDPEVRAAKAIARAEEAIAQAEASASELTDAKSVAAARLLINAKRHLEEARDAFDAKDYGRAFGLATAAKVQAEAALKISQGTVVGNFKRAVAEAEQEIEVEGIAKVKGEIEVEAERHGVKLKIRREVEVEAEAEAGAANQTGVPPKPWKR
jgi:putative cell wall-binding protein